MEINVARQLLKQYKPSFAVVLVEKEKTQKPNLQMSLVYPVRG